jgi:hypothetical protein
VDRVEGERSGPAGDYRSGWTGLRGKGHSDGEPALQAAADLRGNVLHHSNAATRISSGCRVIASTSQLALFPGISRARRTPDVFVNSSDFLSHPLMGERQIAVRLLTRRHKANTDLRNCRFANRIGCHHASSKQVTCLDSLGIRSEHRTLHRREHQRARRLHQRRARGLHPPERSLFSPWLSPVDSRGHGFAHSELGKCGSSMPACSCCSRYRPHRGCSSGPSRHGPWGPSAQPPMPRDFPRWRSSSTPASSSRGGNNQKSGRKSLQAVRRSKPFGPPRGEFEGLMGKRRL